MRRSLKVLALCAALCAALAATGSEAADGGICPMLGCGAGEAKCADGTAVEPDGREWTFTCYTNIRQM